MKDMQRTSGNRAVQRMMSGGTAQRTVMEEDELQMKSAAPAQRMAMEEDELQMKSAAPPVQRKGEGMPEPVRAKMEQAFGTDFSDVRVHTGNQAEQVGALAYAQGDDIHFAPGQYNPETSKGQELLGHELAHVVQQKQGRVKPTTEVNGVAVNADPSLEREADQWGIKAAQTKLDSARYRAGFGD
ncbi:DUF4157 domain-containing protein [Paenibacillus sp. A3]|uniref:eCIS core domain-containing protein n=1 Tax=Paenibacillus sp. A3 TaxID=1337054 RepID=UPI0006D55311|nr:DUF4157 domain-containing protein [Paenibacillus sp. A3]